MPIDASMKDAWRKSVVSTSMPGRPGLHRVERRFDVAGDVERVDVRELLDDQDEAGAVADEAVADERLVVLDDGRDVAERQRRRAVVRGRSRTWARSSAERIGRMCWIAEPLLGVSMKPPVPGRRRLEEGQRRDPQRVAGGLDDVLERDAALAEPGRVDQDLELPLALAEDRDVGDARHAHQPRPDRPAREDRHLDRATAPSSSARRS